MGGDYRLVRIADDLSIELDRGTHVTSYLRFSVNFLDSRYHGRRDGGEPEWPPSPLRLFQGLVAGAAGHWNERRELTTSLEALQWCERQATPVIVAPAGTTSSIPYRVYVPNNAADLVAAAWSRGNTSASVAEHRTEKDVRPTHLPAVALSYLFPVTSEIPVSILATLRSAARAITHLGWGIDLVVADVELLSEDQAAALPGERWIPTNGGNGIPLRVPKPGTLDDLRRKHQDFLNRLSPEGFRPVPPLTCFDVVNYRRATDQAPMTYAAFGLLTSDASGYRSFDVGRRTAHVAGMVRHAVAHMATQTRPFGWTEADINVFVQGKSPEGDRPAVGTTSPDRFSYLPLPTINHKLQRVESIRRVLVAAPARCDAQIQWVRRALSGIELSPEGSSDPCVLALEPSNNWVVKQYTGAARAWSTVTPVLLPGHDDRSERKAEKLLFRAFEQAGYSAQLLTQSSIEFRRVGFLVGADLVTRYTPPENLCHLPRYHVRIQFPHPMAGPIAVGSGRFRGYGLFAREDQSTNQHE